MEELEKVLNTLKYCNRPTLDAFFMILRPVAMQMIEEHFGTKDPEELKTKINGELDPEDLPTGFGSCPICGSPLGWGSTAMRDECGGAPEGDSSVVNFLSCHYCGASVDVYEALDEEKLDYTYWVEREEELRQDDD